jgi:hypothetical protein
MLLDDALKTSASNQADRFVFHAQLNDPIKVDPKGIPVSADGI